MSYRFLGSAVLTGFARPVKFFDLCGTFESNSVAETVPLSVGPSFLSLRAILSTATIPERSQCSQRFRGVDRHQQLPDSDRGQPCELKRSRIIREDSAIGTANSLQANPMLESRNHRWEEQLFRGLCLRMSFWRRRSIGLPRLPSPALTAQASTIKLIVPHLS